MGSMDENFSLSILHPPFIPRALQQRSLLIEKVQLAPGVYAFIQWEAVTSWFLSGCCTAFANFSFALQSFQEKT